MGHLMNMYVIAQVHEDGYLLLTVAEGVLAFEHEHDAEDFADQLDEPGEFVALVYDPSMGPMVVAV